MEIFKIIILGVIQGITEFLPVSSSGHLAVASKLFGINDNALLIAVVLHAGSLFSILAVYYKEILKIFKEQRNMIPVIITAIVPIGIVGFAFELFHLGDKLFENMFVVSGGLFLTSMLLFFGMKKSIADDKNEGKEFERISYKDALIVGLLQCIAILPGVSRSGTTISTALRLNIKRESAASFSFIIALPVIGAAAFLKMFEYIMHLKDSSVSVHHIPGITLFAGFAASAVVGVISLKFLIYTVKEGKLNIFAYYCLCLSLIILTIAIWW
jgi:undecaprenyl-diphosphatase